MSDSIIEFPDVYTLFTGILTESGPMGCPELSVITGLPKELTGQVLLELARRGVIDVVDSNTGKKVDIDD